MSKKGSVNPFARTVTNTAPQQPQQQQQYNAPRGQPQGRGGGRGGGGGGSVNPFAAGAQISTFGQPVQQPQQQQPRPYQQNNNRQQGQNQYQQPQQQQAPRNPFGNQQQPQAQQYNPAGRGNPFASASSGGNTMEMDSGMGMDTNRSGNMFNQPRAQNQQGQSGPRSFGNQPRPVASANPFAPAGNTAGGIFAAQNKPGFQQPGYQQPAPAASRNPFSQASPFGSTPASNAYAQPQQQAYQPQQQFQQGSQFQQSSFQARQGGGFPSAPAAPVRAEVNAHALSAVNVSAALTSNKVDEIDLGLGLGMPEPPSATVALLPPPSAFAMNSTGAGASKAPVTGIAMYPVVPTRDGVSAPDAEAEQLQTLLRTLLASSALATLPEEAPADDPYALMTSTGTFTFIAGRVPAVPPAKVSSNSLPGHKPQQGRASGNPFAGGYQ